MVTDEQMAALEAEFHAWRPDGDVVRGLIERGPRCVLHDTLLTVEHACEERDPYGHIAMTCALACERCASPASKHVVTCGNSISIDGRLSRQEMPPQFRAKREAELLYATMLLFLMHQRIGWRYYDACLERDHG